MNKKTTVALIVAGSALAIGGGVYFYRKNKAQQLINQYPATSQNTGVVAQGQNLVNTGQNIISQVQSLLKPQTTSTGQYEGKLVRENKGPVYVVANNLKHYVSKLPTPDGRWNWGMQDEVKSLPLQEGETYDQMMAKYIDPMQPWIGLKGLGRLRGGMGEVMIPMIQSDGTVIYSSPRQRLGQLPTLLTLN